MLRDFPDLYPMTAFRSGQKPWFSPQSQTPGKTGYQGQRFLPTIIYVLAVLVVSSAVIAPSAAFLSAERAVSDPVEAQLRAVSRRPRRTAQGAQRVPRTEDRAAARRACAGRSASASRMPEFCAVRLVAFRALSSNSGAMKSL